jgi:IS30 family transposase
VAGRRMLTGAAREEISRGVAAGEEQKEIAARIGRDPGVGCREIARHGGRQGYRAAQAAARARRSRARPRARKLDAGPGLRQDVTALLKAGCSPGQAAGRLRFLRGQGQGHAGTVSAETIYTWLCALPTGELTAQGIILKIRPRRAPPPPPAARPRRADRWHDQHR